jgi:hypothetical protein
VDPSLSGMLNCLTEVLASTPRYRLPRFNVFLQSGKYSDDSFLMARGKHPADHAAYVTKLRLSSRARTLGLGHLL